MTEVYIDKVIGHNHICFEKNGTYYYANISGDTITDILKRNLMNIYMERYEQDNNIQVNYDDIITISCCENHDDIIQDLPNKLRRLFMMNSTCTSILLSEQNKQTIEYIHIDKTNINVFIDVSECQKLKELKINHSNLSRFNTPLPESLIELNLYGNVLINKNFNFAPISKQMEKHPNTKDGIRLNLNDNYFVHDLIPENIQKRYLFLRQGTYKHHPITFRNVHEENIRNMVFINNNNDSNGVKNILSNNSQTVHLSSINKSVEKSYFVIEEYLTKNELSISKLDMNFSSNIISSLYNDCIKSSKIKKEQQEFEQFCSSSSNILSFIKEHFLLSTVHSIIKKTYKEIFELIWTIIMHHPSKEDLLVRLKDELLDSQGMCFTGCVNRLFNALMGFIEGIKVSISYKEEIQMSIQMILIKTNKFIDENKNTNIDEEKIHKQLQDFMYETDSLFCGIPKDILESEKITTEYCASWMDTIVELYENTFGKYIININNKKYEILWNDDIVETEMNENGYIVGIKTENDCSFF